jgi:heme-degrading monooxygenase HmoA
VAIRATLTITVKDGAETAFEGAWRQIALRIGEQPDSLRQTLARDPESPRTFIITSDWSSREAFGHFERSPEQDDLTAPLRELRESARMTVHNIVEHIDRGTG